MNCPPYLANSIALVQRHPHLKNRLRSGHTSELNRATVGFHSPLYDGQPQPSALHLLPLSPCAAEKAFKNKGRILRRYANAIV
jgi:hypothetical protein